MTRVMHLQARLKRAVKPLLFADDAKPRTIKLGPGRGIVVILNRRHDLQREFGLYERELHHVYRRGIARGAVAYDVGAADGLEALMYAALGARVFAFEPNADAVGALRRNVALNPDLDVTVVAGRFEPGHAPAPDFVKIDVDGAELEVLHALSDLPSTIVIETHSPQLESACADALEVCGYTVQIVGPARWRRLYPEWRPIEFNRWLVGRRERE